MYHILTTFVCSFLLDLAPLPRVIISGRLCGAISQGGIGWCQVRLIVGYGWRTFSAATDAFYLPIFFISLGQRTPAPRTLDSTFINGIEARHVPAVVILLASFVKCKFSEKKYTN